MKPLFRIPTRNANDADHMAIMILIGGILSFRHSDQIFSMNSPWFVVGIISVITAPLLWLRIPYAKFGGIIASLILAGFNMLNIVEHGLGMRIGLTTIAFLIIAYWFYKIDYDHVFED